MCVYRGGSLTFGFMYFLYIFSIYLEEEAERKLYFNNMLHIHQHAFLKYMIQSVIEGKNQSTNMSVYDISLFIPI